MAEGGAKTPETKRTKTDSGVKKGQDTGKKGLDGGKPKTPEGGVKTGG